MSGAPESGAAERRLTLIVQDSSYAVCKLPLESGVPAEALRAEFVALTRTEDELSLICAEERVPPGAVCERGWRLLKVMGPFDFSQVGILAALTAALAQAEINLLAISTYETDYLLVKSEMLARAVRALERAGHAVRSAAPREETG